MNDRLRYAVLRALRHTALIVLAILIVAGPLVIVANLFPFAPLWVGIVCLAWAVVSFVFFLVLSFTY